MEWQLEKNNAIPKPPRNLSFLLQKSQRIFKSTRWNHGGTTKLTAKKVFDKNLGGVVH